MLDIKKIIAELFLGIFDGVPVFVSDLCPSRDSGPNRVPKIVVRNLLPEPFDKLGTLRARTNQPHLAFEHIPQLRNFVEPCGSQEASDGGNSRILIVSPGSTCIRLCVCPHGAKLVAVKNLIVFSDTLLVVEEPSWRRQFDGEGYERKKWQRKDQANNRHHDRGKALVDHEVTRKMKTGREKKRAQAK